jgi:hypothetical protein
MKKWMYALLLTALLMGVNGCVPTSDIEVESVTNEKANLGGYKTYQFLEDSGVVEMDDNGKLKDAASEVSAMIEEIINDQLQKKGKRPVSKSPDFFVAYVGGTDKEAIKVRLDDEGKQIVETAPEAALLIMLIDAKTGEVLKVSTAEGELKTLPKAEQKERIEYAVQKMLQDI